MISEDALKYRTLSIHIELLSEHDCMFRTINPCFTIQAKAVQKDKRYCWTRIHAFGEKCLKAPTDKAKQPNCNKTINGCHHLEWQF